jgi:hypothetical protein
MCACVCVRVCARVCVSVRACVCCGRAAHQPPHVGVGRGARAPACRPPPTPTPPQPHNPQPTPPKLTYRTFNRDFGLPNCNDDDLAPLLRDELMPVRAGARAWNARTAKRAGPQARGQRTHGMHTSTRCATSSCRCGAPAGRFPSETGRRAARGRAPPPERGPRPPAAGRPLPPPAPTAPPPAPRLSHAGPRAPAPRARPRAVVPQPLPRHPLPRRAGCGSEVVCPRRAWFGWGGGPLPRRRALGGAFGRGAPSRHCHSSSLPPDAPRGPKTPPPTTHPTNSTPTPHEGIVNFIDARTQWIDEGMRRALDDGIEQVGAPAPGRPR